MVNFAEVEAKNQELFSLQRQCLQLPKRERTLLKQQMARLDTEIARLCCSTLAGKRINPEDGQEGQQDSHGEVQGVEKHGKEGGEDEIAPAANDGNVAESAVSEERRSAREMAHELLEAMEGCEARHSAAVAIQSVWCKKTERRRRTAAHGLKAALELAETVLGECNDEAGEIHVTEVDEAEKCAAEEAAGRTVAGLEAIRKRLDESQSRVIGVSHGTRARVELEKLRRRRLEEQSAQHVERAEPLSTIRERLGESLTEDLTDKFEAASRKLQRILSGDEGKAGSWNLGLNYVDSDGCGREEQPLEDVLFRLKTQFLRSADGGHTGEDISIPTLRI